MTNPMLEIIDARKAGRNVGIYSCCSANEYVITASLERGLQTNSSVLIEATANQVNQFGGYTGMVPSDFVSFVYAIADRLSFPRNRLILGGDHLGPLLWQKDTEAVAMEKAKVLIYQYVSAGFSKIHIDTSMKVADDDPDTRLSDQVIARRAAILCEVAEAASSSLRAEHPEFPQPVYIIGSEVPIPGGAQQDEDSVHVTTADEFRITLSAFRDAFLSRGLEDAFNRVIGVVAQPGVEFGDTFVLDYDPAAAKDLTTALKEYEGIVFEGHSTDYQTADNLRAMVCDGIAILKVGPALTFAMREAIFALNDIEEEVLGCSGIPLSNFRKILDQKMLELPGYWEKHYQGDAQQKTFKRKYSYSDRCRYYFADPDINHSLDILMHNIDNYPIPLNILSQYLPVQYKRIRDQELTFSAAEIIKDRVKDTIDDYLYATAVLKT